MAGPPLLQVRDLDVSYGAARTLFGVNLAVHEGERLAVVGHNGWGKTTLARTVTGFLRPAGGRVTFAGADVAALAAHRVARLGMAFVPQGRHVFASLTVEENLRIAATSAEQRARWRAMYEVFPSLAARARNRASDLSGGEQQMLAISRALVRLPRLLVLDEPTEGLAPVVVEQLRDALLALAAEERLTVLLLEQRESFAAALCPTVLRMAGRGRLAPRAAVPDAG